MKAALVVMLLMCWTGCALDGADGTQDAHLDAVSLRTVGPELLLRGTRIIIEGSGFVGSPYGQSWLHLHGSGIDARVRGEVTTPNRMETVVGEELALQLGAGFDGGARIEVRHSTSGRVEVSNAIGLHLEVVDQLAPDMALAPRRTVRVNDPVTLVGGGLLLGGAEGQSIARVRGCFFADASTTCSPVPAVRLPIESDSPPDRSGGSFRFSPALAGIRPGRFRGTVEIENVHGDGEVVADGVSQPLELDLVGPAVDDIPTEAATLGRYVDLFGGGFIGGGDEALTLLEISGTFHADSGRERPIETVVVPEYVEGRHLRYVPNGDDGLGQAIHLRRERGVLDAELTVIIRYRGDEVRGVPRRVTLELGGVRQVVFVSYQQSFNESLRRFGLRAAAAAVRRQAALAAAAPYAGVAVELRQELPSDYAVYTHVDVAGPDPNGLGLFGYDNTPGKDINNLRLHDRIGGVNATTQEDGFPGFGGVFVDSFLGFSPHPPSGVIPLPSATSTFDALFDPFRPDRGGSPVTAAELSDLPEVHEGRGCPTGNDRPRQIACAIHALGQLVGGTIAHELGHSLGLADPEGDDFHNDGDEERRLMDSGGSRPFEERATVDGSEAGLFCDDAYAYLREILPNEATDPEPYRPSCR